MNVFLFVFVPLTSTLIIQLSVFFDYLFRFLKVLSQLGQIIEEALYLLLHCQRFSKKQLNQIMYKFIWGPKWKKIGHFQSCCDMKEKGGIVIDIK